MGVGTSSGGAGFNRIGGKSPEERNIISGNLAGIVLSGRGDLVLGNYIGTDITGRKPIPNNQGGIILIETAQRITMGGTTEAERNVISGNRSAPGISVGLGSDHNFIGGNFIGVDSSGGAPLANQGGGVNLQGDGNTVQGNTIAHNIGAGVVVNGFAGNTIRRNTIYSNAGKGIEIDNGGNKDISCPKIDAVNATNISGAACAGCTVEVFSDSEDEGRIYEGTATADASGKFIFSKSTSFAGPNITATATDRDGSTSEFSVPQKVPLAAATLIAPSGSITTDAPTYLWNAVANATYYYLWVNDSTTNSGKIKRWYTAAEAGCASGETACSATPSTPLSLGDAQWWIQTYNANGYGPWSLPLSFTVTAGSPPGKASLISPSGTIVTSLPAYKWNAVAGATWYQLWVNDATISGKIKQWYTAAQAGCSSGTGTCSVTSATALALGAARWWVQTWNDAGYRPRSDPMAFEVMGAGKGQKER